MRHWALGHCGIGALGHCGIGALGHCGIGALWHWGIVALGMGLWDMELWAWNPNKSMNAWMNEWAFGHEIHPMKLD
jgi:hypothetical protein